MTVGELKKLLDTFGDDIEILVSRDRGHEHFPLEVVREQQMFIIQDSSGWAARNGYEYEPVDGYRNVGPYKTTVAGVETCVVLI